MFQLGFISSLVFFCLNVLNTFESSHPAKARIKWEVGETQVSPSFIRKNRPTVSIASNWLNV